MSDDQTHIEYLFRSYYARLCYFATQLTGDAGLSEDIVQEVFLNYWKIRLTFPHEQVAKRYLYNSVRNACLNHARHQDVIKRHASFAHGEDVSTGPVIEEIVRAELMGEVHAAIETLPEGCRTILKMAYFEKLRNEEIAAMLGVSVNTVKTQKMRAIRLLRLRLDPLSIALFLLLQHSGEWVQ
jgi:RNA polymerase sigma-70 factor (family 1)